MDFRNLIRRVTEILLLFFKNRIYIFILRTPFAYEFLSLDHSWSYVWAMQKYEGWQNQPGKNLRVVPLDWYPQT